jgi:small-conductance mechanosensitive channel
MAPSRRRTRNPAGARAVAWASIVGVLLVAALAIPQGANADRLGGSSVLFYAPGPSPISLHLGESSVTSWLFYNDGNDSVYVGMAADGSAAGLSASPSPTFLVLDPGQWGQIDLRLAAPREGPDISGAVRVHLSGIDLRTGATSSQDVDLPASRIGVSVQDDPTGKLFGTWPNLLPPPLDNKWAAFGVSVGIWAAAVLALVFLVNPVVRRMAKRSGSWAKGVALQLLRGPVFLLAVLHGAVTSLAILGPPADLHATVLALYGFLFILLVTWVAYRLFRDLLVRYGKDLSKRTRSNIDDRLVPVLDKVGAVVIVLFGTMFAVQSLGYDITVFLAGFGVAGLVIAFAAQDTLSNFFAGVHLMLDRPFRVGDLIEIEEGVVCQVQDIGLRSTKLYWGKSHDLIIMPNKELANRKIVNYVRPDRRFRINIKVGVAYDSDLEAVRRVMTEAALAHPWVLKGAGDEPIWRVVDFGDSAITVMIFVWVDDVDHQWQLGSDLRLEIKRKFDVAGIEIPFPHRVVRVAGSDGTPGVSGPSEAVSSSMDARR